MTSFIDPIMDYFSVNEVGKKDDRIRESLHLFKDILEGDKDGF